MVSLFMQRHDHWLAIAQEDLCSAKHLHSALLSTALFHTQQCAEKSLKAYLVFRQGMAIKTHDFVRLVDMCMEFNNHFETLRSLATVITPYETAGRYPDTSFAIPSQERTKKLIEQSEYVFHFVTNQISK